jgi:tRNA modification GTPase
VFSITLKKRLTKINHLNDDTIAAISTPVGRGAIGILRLSGKNALKTALKVFRNEGNRFKGEITPQRTYLGQLYDRDMGVNIDRGILTYFKSPSSYTGEDVVEISTHGSPVILERVLSPLIKPVPRLA